MIKHHLYIQGSSVCIIKEDILILINFILKNPLGLLQIIIVHALPTMQVKQIRNNGENIKNKKSHLHHI